MVKWNLVISFIGTILIPFLYLFNIFIIYKTPNSLNFPLLIIATGIILAALGLVLWIISYISLGSSFGVLPQKQKRVTRGIYKYMKHPMYDGIYLTFAGLSIANQSWQGLLYLNLILLPILIIRAFFEEKNLT